MTEELRNGGRFQTTRWTHVLAARGNAPEAKQALRDLCEAYYAPVELFLRRHQDTDSARDLTHEFFAKLLEGNSLDHLDRTRGRFRTYLLGAAKHFLADFNDRMHAASRGGGHVPQSLDRSQTVSHTDDGETHDIPDAKAFPPDAFFDRDWGKAVVERAVETLHHEALTSGDVARFEVLKHWLVTPASQDTSSEAARSLNMSDGAFNVAVHRLRKRFRAVVKSLIADTLNDPAEIAEELQYLVCALTSAIPESCD